MKVKCSSCPIVADQERMSFSRYDLETGELISMCPKCFAKNNPSEVKTVVRCIFCKHVMKIRVFPDTIDDVCTRCRNNPERLAKFA